MDYLYVIAFIVGIMFALMLFARLIEFLCRYEEHGKGNINTRKQTPKPKGRPTPGRPREK